MMGSARWGVVLILGFGASWASCSSKHDAPSGVAGSAGRASGSTAGDAGNAAIGGAGKAQAGAESGGTAGAPDNDDGGDAGSANAGSANAGSANAGSANAGSANAGSANGGSANGGSANGGSSHGGAGHGGAGSGGMSTAGNAGAGGACQAFEATLNTTAPTVFVLVDRSSSMFLCLSGSGELNGPNCADLSVTPWGALKKGMLEVVQELQGSVRFGFGTFTGQQTGTCPSFTAVGAALNNYDAIHAAYDDTQPPMFKAETPTAQALGMVQTLLASDNSPGPKYVLLVTDGEPDFCDDGPAGCPVDATVSRLQAMSSAGLGTLVMGVDSPLTSISGASLQAFANAGAGLPVTDPSGMGTGLYYSCAGITGWNTLFTATGKVAPAVLATYGTPANNATVYRPDTSNGAALKQALAGPVAGVKSCTFDLAAGLAVDLGALASAKVSIQGQAVTQSSNNGWSMLNTKHLQLNGSACTLWRNPASQTIAFDFPCGSVKKE